MPVARITICLDEPSALIRPEIYGQFAEHLGAGIEGGIWVGQDSSIAHLGGLRRDVVEALQKIRVPVLRWPGGCYADDYHWEDGVGPPQERPRRVNLWWGKNVETNQFGTHEFIHLCRLLGAKPYLAGNLGSGSVRELRDWVEYCNYPGDSTLARRRGQNGSPHPFGVGYWGVGNENWGCGGNFCPEDYAAQYKRYATYLHDMGSTPLFLIACGPDGNDANWTRRFLAKFAAPRGPALLHGLAAHYYCPAAGDAVQFSVDQWYQLLADACRVEELIVQQRAVLDEFDRERRIGLVVDEWGTWHPPTPGRNPRHLWQQNTLRDALAAALTLDIFNRHADKVHMANIAQMVNVLQAMVLTDGPRMILTPTYHVFEMYQVHQGAQGLRAIVEAPEISFAAGSARRSLPHLAASASIQGRTLSLSVVNPHTVLPVDAVVALRGGQGRGAVLRTLSNDDLTAHNTFENPQAIVPRQQHSEFSGDQTRHTFDAASVTVMKVELP